MKRFSALETYQNHSELYNSYLLGWLLQKMKKKPQKNQKTSVDMDVENLENVYIAGGTVQGTVP